MKNNQNAKKEITRDEYIKIRVSKEEKEVFYKFAEEMKISPSRLARNILMQQAESTVTKYAIKPFAKAYIKYLEATKDYETLARLKKE